jgi:RNA polymerase sigma factor (sigma-70 family)
MTEVSSDAGLYAEHQKGLMRFATTLVGISDAADVVSDAVESLVRADSLPSADNPQALLYRAVHNRARSYQRSMIRRRRREHALVSDLLVVHPELRPDVTEAVIGLSHRQKACVYLTYWQDLSAGEVADWLDISEGSVKRHLARARARLREVLDE